MGIDVDLPLGDPALLVPDAVRKSRTRHQVGLVPHYTHKEKPWIQDLLDQGCFLVDVSRQARSVVRDISSCDRIITTSLHGLIIADAYGIPAAWAQPSPLRGGLFKFHDYESIFSRSDLGSRFLGTDPGRNVAKLVDACQSPRMEEVAAAQRGLRDSRRKLRSALLLERPAVSPVTVPLVQMRY